jgi:hypothetical protein
MRSVVPISTKEVTEPLFRHAAGTPLNIAPENGQKLAAEIFGGGKWELKPSSTPANFYALPADKAIYLSYAGLSSLWCVAYAAFHERHHLLSTLESKFLNGSAAVSKLCLR